MRAQRSKALFRRIRAENVRKFAGFLILDFGLSAGRFFESSEESFESICIPGHLRGAEKGFETTFKRLPWAILRIAQSWRNAFAY